MTVRDVIREMPGMKTALVARTSAMEVATARTLVKVGSVHPDSTAVKTGAAIGVYVVSVENVGRAKERPCIRSGG